MESEHLNLDRTWIPVGKGGKEVGGTRKGQCISLQRQWPGKWIKHQGAYCSVEAKKETIAISMIRFLGLLDTVGALGVPQLNPGMGIQYEFYDTNVSWQVGFLTDSTILAMTMGDA